MRIAEANRPGQRSRRSWRIRHPVEQAGTVGKRRAVPGHDRSPLDPIFGSGSKIAAFEMRNFGLNSRQGYASACSHCYTIAVCAASADTSHRPHESVERCEGEKIFDASTGSTTRA